MHFFKALPFELGLLWVLRHRLKPSPSSQWSLLRSFVRDFVCISFVWLTSLRQQSHTKLMQKKSLTKLRTRLHKLERLDYSHVILIDSDLFSQISLPLSGCVLRANLLKAFSIVFLSGSLGCSPDILRILQKSMNWWSLNKAPMVVLELKKINISILTWVINGWWRQVVFVMYGCLFWFALNQRSAAQ